MNAPLKTIAAHYPAAIQTADGLALAYESWGDGPPIVLVSSWAMQMAMWRQQIPALTDAGFRAVAFDRRGHGRSGGNGQGYDIDTLADDLAAVIDQLDLKDAVLVGHSMAGAEISRYLSRHGSGRVVKVVLLAPATPCLVKADDNPLGLDPELVAQSRAAMRADFTAWVADNAGPFFTPDTPEPTMRWLIDMLLDCPLSVAMATLIAYFDVDFRDDMRAIDVPALIVHGDVDASAPLEITGQPTAALIPGAKLQVLKGAPHGLFLTHAEAVNRAIVDFAKA
ncbi:alpha/beta hydrolase [Phenylobacterium sp.]|uniref:alpha/beta fold hydrolase n=1 Tax=Phenylobacterium sp. TaxID=1871053 RepID=UPI001220017A|nr:alpha/beta hydrolase [Phenylobacterium sp.]THD58543.1 MAG: alpha/beta fold hydrolase [Phenylobacterium sp.]